MSNPTLETGSAGRNEYLGVPASSWVALLRSEDPLTRRLAAHALGMIGPAAREVSVPALAEAIEKDEASFVRVWSASALAKVDPDDPRALAGLRAAMRDELNFVRSLGAWFLGRVGPRLPERDEALADLDRLREDEDPSVRAETEVALRILRKKNVRPRG
ncbi:HEAT repeat domain-containing protein [Tautonia sociabilis]|uniref:HEAT repeat domain-containing protein n=1 Tax=Tautonia sociabilis TaxID=2080755 RepID=A0A432MPI6_9BACT|nr:HEAT repeat domain-containing protein [Tautonia sociabilis]RUL89250.1 HEAT repeat domain-containing protein [Tautonia sociabilis]